MWGQESRSYRTRRKKLEISILVHRRYRNAIQRIHAYHWQQQGDWQEGRENWREGEDQREEEAPHQKKEL